VTGRLWRITGRGFVAGLVVHDGVVVEAAPLLRRRALGRRWGEVRAQLVAEGCHGEPL
jgi:hypothetical protein